MKITLIGLAIVAFVFPAPIRAEYRTVEYEMTELQWQCTSVVRATFDGSAVCSIDVVPTSIDSVAIRFVGSAELGVIQCPELVFGAFDLMAYLRNPDGPGYWIAGDLVWESGPFDMTSGFRTFTDCTLDFLFDGAGEVDFGGFPAVTICVHTWPLSTATLEAAYLIVMGEYSVAASTDSWGGIKCIFR